MTKLEEYMVKDGRKKLTLKEKYKIIFDRLFPKLFAKVYPFKFQDFKLTE